MWKLQLGVPELVMRIDPSVRFVAVRIAQSDFWDFFSDVNKAELYWLPFNAGKLFKITPVAESEKQFLEFRKYSKAHK